MWPASAAVAARTPTSDDFEVVGREVLVEAGSTLKTLVSICSLNRGMMVSACVPLHCSHRAIVSVNRQFVFLVGHFLPHSAL